MRLTSSACLIAACYAFGMQSVAASPTPDASPAGTAAKPSPLHEIGHVRAQTPFCQAVYDHAGLSTATALQNDTTITQTAADLKVAELDEDMMAKPKAIASMQASYEALMARTKDAIQQTIELRKLADQAPTADQKAALIAYADALGGALHRQEIDAKDYREFGVFLEAQDPVSWQQHDRDLMAAAITEPGPLDTSADPRDRVPTPLATLAKSEAVHLLDMHELVVNDEVHASSNVDDAFSPCQTDQSSH